MCIQIYKLNILKIVFERTFRLRIKRERKKQRIKIKRFQNKQATSSHIALNSNIWGNNNNNKKCSQWRGKKWFVSSAATVARINTRLRFSDAFKRCICIWDWAFVKSNKFQTKAAKQFSNKTTSKFHFFFYFYFSNASWSRAWKCNFIFGMMVFGVCCPYTQPSQSDNLSK